jgi:hypothetical protein
MSKIKYATATIISEGYRGLAGIISLIIKNCH